MKSLRTIRYYQSEMIGSTKVEIFAEKLDSPCIFIDRQEFLFKINNSTSKKSIFYINDLYKIFMLVQKSLRDYIDNNILSSVKDKQVQLIIEAEGASSDEIKQKDKLYSQHLEKLSKIYSDENRGIYCSYGFDGKVHLLNFSRLTTQ